MNGTGRCLCGAIRFAFEGPTLWCTHCHCESCRRQTASAFTTFFAVPKEHFRWSAATPGVFESSPGVIRSFCRDCGTPLAYEPADSPDEIHLYLASLDTGNEGIRPEGHDFREERVRWVQLADDLPDRS